MHPPPAHPPHQQAVVDLELDGGVQRLLPLLEQRLQLLRLAQRAGEPVQEEAAVALRLVQVLGDHLEDQLVVDQLPLVDLGLDLLAQLAAAADLGAEEVARRQVANLQDQVVQYPFFKKD